MIKMTISGEDKQFLTLKIEGKIVGLWVEELRKECEKCLKRKNQLILDLSDVDYIDEKGVKILRGILGPRVQAIGLSFFLEGLLREKKVL